MIIRAIIFSLLLCMIKGYGVDELLSSNQYALFSNEQSYILFESNIPRDVCPRLFYETKKESIPGYTFGGREVKSGSVHLVRDFSGVLKPKMLTVWLSKEWRNHKHIWTLNARIFHIQKEVVEGSMNNADTRSLYSVIRRVFNHIDRRTILKVEDNFNYSNSVFDTLNRILYVFGYESNGSVTQFIGFPFVLNYPFKEPDLSGGFSFKTPSDSDKIVVHKSNNYRSNWHEDPYTNKLYYTELSLDYRVQLYSIHMSQFRIMLEEGVKGEFIIEYPHKNHAVRVAADILFVRVWHQLNDGRYEVTTRMRSILSDMRGATCSYIVPSIDDREWIRFSIIKGKDYCLLENKSTKECDKENKEWEDKHEYLFERPSKLRNSINWWIIGALLTLTTMLLLLIVYIYSIRRTVDEDTINALNGGGAIIYYPNNPDDLDASVDCWSH